MASVGFRLGVSALAVAVGVFGGVARAGDTITYAPAGSWVKPVAFTPSDAVAGAWRTGLVDIQVNLMPGATTTYVETDTLAHPNNVGTTFIHWDAASETPIIHKAEIHRGAETIDLLAGGQAFQIAPLPIAVPAIDGDSSAPAIDYTRQAVFSPTGVQAGDIVVIAWSIERRDPGLKDHYDAVVTMPVYQVDRLYVRAVWPRGRPLHWKADPLFDGGQMSSSDAGNELVIDRRNPPPPGFFQMADSGWQQPRLVLSDFSGWSDVAATLAPAFTKAATLEAQSPLRAEAERLRAGALDPEAQVTAAWRYLQSRLHLGAAAGEEALTAPPKSADALWTVRAADPKSVAIELVALLRAMNLHADIALASSAFGHSLDHTAPDIHVLDQMLVRVEIDGKAFWIDPATVLADDRDLDHLTVPGDPRWVLPLGTGASGLERLDRPAPSQPMMETRIRMDASAGLEVPVQAHIERVYRDDTGRLLGGRLETMLPGQVDDAVRQTLESGYFWLHLQTVNYRYDPLTGELRLAGDGVAQLPWRTNAPSPMRVFMADNFAVRGGPGELSAGTAPLSDDIPAIVTYPEWTTKEETIVLPNGGKGFGTLGDGAVDMTLAGVRYRREAALSGGIFTVTASSRAVSPEVPRPEAFKDAPALQALVRQPVYLSAPLDYASTPADLAAGERNRPSTPRALFVRGAAYYAAAENAAALVDFDAALKLQPDWPEALADRGAARTRLKDLDGAAADFKAALALDAQNAAAYEGLGAVATARKDYDGAVAAFSQAITLHPSYPNLHLQRARAHLLAGDNAAAITDAQAELQISSGNGLTANLVLIDAEVAAGQTDDAIARARALVAQYPGDDRVHTELGALLGCFAGNMHNCHADKPAALDEQNKAIALHPTAYAYVNRSQARPLKDIDGRQADLDAALALEPDFDFALLTRAALYLYEKVYDKALADANTVLARTPNDPQALNIRAIVYGQTKQYDLQTADLDTLIRLNPNNAAALNSRCWMRAVRNIELDKAMDDCNAAITLSPMPGYYDSRALVNFRLGKLDAAVADYDTALANRPDLAGSLYGRGLVELRQGKTAEGQADIAKAVGLNPRVTGEYGDMGLTPTPGGAAVTPPANPPA